MACAKGESGTERDRMVECLVKFFKSHGRVPSRRVYSRLVDVPFKVSTIERVMGWGNMKRVVAETLSPVSVSSDDEGRYKDPKLLTGDDYDRLTIMAGLKEVGLPKRYRRILGEMVMNIEHSLLKLPRYELPERDTNAESAILLLSDLHSGKKHFHADGAVSYNMDIMTFRMSLIKEQVLRLLDERIRLGRLDEFIIAMIGDIVDGSGIYPGQELNQDLTCFVDQISLVVACIWDLVQTVRSEYKIPVRIKGVRGNHGRQYKYCVANNNFDYLVFHLLYILAWTYDRKGVAVDYGSVPYMNFKVKGFGCHMRHEAPVQSETPAAKAKFAGWKIMHNFDMMFYGHKHHPGNGSILDGEVFMNGCLVGVDELSESMATFSRPSQTLIGVDPGMGRTYTYNLYADKFAVGGEAASMLKKYPFLMSPLRF